MDSNNYQTPDLASVLRTLAAYAPPLQQVPQPPLEASVPDGELEEGEYDPANPLMLPVPLNPIPKQTILPKPSPDPAPRVVTPSIPEVDPTTITTWPAALRHVTKLIARNEAVMARMRKLIEVQRQHEQQWWEGREALIKKQHDRIEGRKMVDDVLYVPQGLNPL